MNHLVFLVLDSLRFDSLRSARARWMKGLGKLERRFSYASWTSPSHLVYSMGLLPHASPRRLFASTQYAADLLSWRTKLALPNLGLEKFLPELSLPVALKKLGYGTHALVSLPVLNPATPFGRLFDSCELMPRHNDFASMIEHLSFDGDQPRFYFLNAGETHYPYTAHGERVAPDLARLSGLHGVCGRAGARGLRSAIAPAKMFSRRRLKELHEQQVACAEHVDALLPRLYARCPRNTWIVVTSDHGEAFGEDGFFGHGPIMHEKVFEVPLIEGRVPH